MTVYERTVSKKPRARSGFTLIELMISVALLALVIQGVVLGYVGSSRRAEWNAHSLAAQSLASQGAEQARSAVWDTQRFPQQNGPGGSDELGITNYVQIGTLDIGSNGKPMWATNYIRITQLSANPPLRQIYSECVWKFATRGMFTNSVILLRAPDQ